MDGSRAVPLAMVVVLLGLLGFALANQHPLVVTPAAALVQPTSTTSTSLPAPTTTTTTAPPPPAPRPVRQVVVPAVPPFVVPTSTMVAAADGDIPKFDAPNGHQTGLVGVFYGFVISMPVLSQQGAWLQVRTPERPNGSTAWVQASDVVTSTTPYRLVLWRSQRRLLVYQGGALVASMPAGVGKAATPTPLGSFFVAAVENPGPPGYGPVVLDTSAHSEVIQSWEGEGDAVIAIHGPISSGADARIGSSGAAISNGCIRLHDADLARLAVIPAGTPLDVEP